MSGAKTFHLGDVLSITTEKLLSPRHIEGVYDVLNHMTGERLFTHQLPRARMAMLPEILRQHPQLSEVDVSAVTPENWRAQLDSLVAKHGAQVSLRPAPPGLYQRQHPIAELETILTRHERDEDGTPVTLIGPQ